MKLPEGVELVEAKYVEDYKYSFLFSDGELSIVDFKPIISYGTMLLGFFRRY